MIKLLMRSAYVHCYCILPMLTDPISKNSLGRLAITGDIWLRVNLEGYLAITITYLHCTTSGAIKMHTQLVAFRHVTESHTGANITKVLMEVLSELGVLNKVCSYFTFGLLKILICSQIGIITLDNASNNNTMMSSVSQELQSLNIPFDVVGNRIR